MYHFTVSITNSHHCKSEVLIVLKRPVVTFFKHVTYLAFNGSQLAKMKKSIPDMSLP